METEKITDTQFILRAINDSLNAVVPVQDVSNRTTWLADLGVRWRPVGNVSLSALGRGLLRSSGSGIASTFDSYNLPVDRSLELGAAWSPVSSLTLAGEETALGRGSFGVEWVPGFNIAARGGLYGGDGGGRFIDAIGLGAGWSYLFLEADASYLFFTDRSARRGTINVSSFDPSGIKDLEISPYTGNTASISIRAVSEACGRAS